MNQRTQRHVAECVAYFIVAFAVLTSARLRALSRRLEEPTARSIPPPASTHIPRQLTLSDQIKTKWNDGLLGLVTEVTRRVSGQ